MAKISLRAYNREIENLIDRGRSDEAIAHCRHILRYYPKHLDTYRLLGKAFLESQHYTEAADILQRVLSAVPDDFISQIGMSIIREDEGNLDAAIFHMERAYEIQPANTAIRDELRRLYGRRDGIEPPRIRLTRGALVRMYARGDLLNQTIAEVRSALAEDPNRTDLEIILARTYFLNDKKVEATEVCSRLVAKLPYCFEANRILASVLPGTSRADDARVYQQRVTTLDPYQAHLTPSVLNSADVPENAVQVEHLDYDPNAEEAPEWVQTLGVSWTDREDEVPSWLKQSAPAETPPDDQVAELEAVEDQTVDDAQIPDFMAQAGWQISDGTEQPEQSSSEEAELDLEPGELAAAEIPDWLKSMAPEGSEAEIGAEDSADDWLKSFLPSDDQQEPSGIAEVEEPFIPEPSSEDQTHPLAETLPGEEAANLQPAEPEQDSTVPDWLVNFSFEEETDAEPVVPAAQGELPAWLRDGSFDEITEGPSAAEPAAQAEIPAWLTGSQEDTGQIEEQPTEPESAVAASQEDSWGQDETEDSSFVVETAQLDSEGNVVQQPGEVPNLDDMDAMAWLESLAARQGADEETLTTRPEDRVETPPEWVAAIAPDDEPVAVPEETEEDIQATFESPITPEEIAPAEPVDAVIDETVTAVEAQLDIPSEEATAESAVEMEEIQFSQQETVVESEDASLPTAEETMSDDDAFAWLESLAARQGAQEGTLITDPESRQDAPPEWVAGLTEDTAVEHQETADLVEQVMAESEGVDEEIDLTEPLEEIAPVELEDDIQTPLVPSVPASELEELEDIPTPEEWSSSDLESSDVSEPPTGWMEPEVEQASTEAVDQQADGSLPNWLESLVEEDSHSTGDENVEIEPPTWLKGMEAEFEPEGAQPSPVASEPETVVIAEGDWSGMLKQARTELESSKIEPAVSKYTRLINSGEFLDETIHDLRDALYRHPIDISLWSTLGDAYYRNNMLQEALDAYNKAEELLR